MTRRGELALTPIADTGDRFTDFAPYVPSIDGRGRVAFRASLAAGGSGIFLGGGGRIDDIAIAGELVRDFTSHPDIADDGSWCAYAELVSGEQALVGGRAGELTLIAGVRAGLAHVGPLGPTMNAAGTIALRAHRASEGAAIYKTSGASVVLVADAGGYGTFHGLPVIDDRGRVVFRADLPGGEQGIYAEQDGTVTSLVDTRGVLAHLGRFPCVGAGGTVVFTAELRDGGSAVFTSSNAGLVRAVYDVRAFESVRGALIDDAGGVVLLATPKGGALGVHYANGGCILALGERCLDSTIIDFALNPVSINGSGQLAIRLALADGRQLIVRADPRG